MDSNTAAITIYIPKKLRSRVFAARQQLGKNDPSLSRILLEGLFAYLESTSEGDYHAYQRSTAPHPRKT